MIKNSTEEHANNWCPPSPLARKLEELVQRGRRRVGFAALTRPNPDPLDVVIPTAPKDAFLLRFCIESLRENLLNPIGTIFVVAPAQSGIEQEASAAGADFVDEREVVPVRREVTAKVDGQTVDRTGNVYQQILKMNCTKISSAPRIMVWDSDTLLMRKTEYSADGNVALACNNYWYPDYLRSHVLLTGCEPVSALSFVMHHMVFDARHLADLKSHMENVHGMAWQDAVYSNLNLETYLNVSEYQTYANYTLAQHPSLYCMRWEKNRPVTGDHQLTRDQLNALADGSDTISLHHHGRA